MTAGTDDRQRTGAATDTARTIAAATALVKSRTPLYAEDFPLIVLYSQKSGSTSAVKWFFWHTGLLDRALALGDWVHTYENLVFKKSPGYRLRLVELLCSGERQLVKFTRNPFQRAVSSFTMLSGPQMRSARYFGHREWQKLRAFKYGNAEDRRGISFLDFLLYLRSTGVGLSQTNPHFAQQFRHEELAFPVQYYPLEEMTAALHRLEDALGLPACPDEVISSSHHRRYAAAAIDNAARMEIEPLTFAAADPPPYRCFYDEVTTELAAELFADDFRHYGFRTTP